MSAIEVKVPDIGDFKDIPVIEVFVKPGDTVKAEDSLITLESDKATMDVPSPAAGVVKELKVKLGDKVSEGTLIAMLCGGRRQGRRAVRPQPGRGPRLPQRLPPRPSLPSAPATPPGQPAASTPQRALPPRRSAARRRQLTPARRMSNARCWSSAPDPAATPQHSGPLTSA